MDKKLKGYVLVSRDAIQQLKSYARLKDIPYNPDASEKSLENVLTEMDNRIAALEEENRKLKENLGLVTKTCEMLIEQAKLSLEQQQLLILKNK